MHLKRVELENFKSFGRKLSIPFLDGFTAITGPNGSGKSNIGDAVLFVLGPKSNKAIRAGKLTDLIFNGGKEKKPADHCKVSLVFDNADRVIPVDTDEVSLTRLVKLSKSDPESYYSYFYVNGRPSSLTEFDSLLAEARITADGYNIVRQGDILKIVEMTPLQRRAIVDEIAGITRFDSDIEKADKERAEVDANLERIGIILAEIDAQIGTLARERDAALRWKAVKDDLELTRAKHAKRKLDGLESDLRTARQLIESETQALADLDREHAAAADRLDAAVRALAETERKIVDRAGPEMADLKAKIDAIKRVAVQAAERLSYAEGEIVDLKRQRTDAQADLKRQEKELARYQKDRDAAVASRDQKAAALAEREAALQLVRDRISATTGAAADVQRDLAELKLRHGRAEEELHETRLALERARDREQRLKAALAESDEAAETQRFEVKSVEVDERQLGDAPTDDPEELRKELFELKKRESKLSAELRDLAPAVHRLQTEYARLKAEVDAKEAISSGYNRAVSAILAARDQGTLRGICGTIAELGEVSQKHAVALEVAAGGMGRMQAVVTETDEDAAAAIEMLKRNKLGRATFLPLNKMVPGRPAGKPLMAVRDPDAEGFAIDLVTFDDRYRNAFWYVFRDTVVVKKLDAARRLMGGVRLVTMEGDLIDAGGAMTGGDRESASASKLKFGASDAAAFEETRKKLQAHIAHQEALSGELSEVRSQLQDVDGRLRDASSATTMRGEKVAALARRRAEALARLATLEADGAQMRRDLMALAGEVAEHEKAASRIERALADMVAQRDAKGKLLVSASPKELAQELQKEEAAVGALREKVRDLQGQVETSDHSLRLIAERRDEIAARLADIEGKLALHAETVRTQSALSREKEAELQVLLAVDAQHSEALRSLTAERDRHYTEKHEAQAATERARAKRNDKQDDIVRHKARIPGIEAELAEAREEIATLVVAPPADVAESMDELRTRLRRLERDLQGLGSVNMHALEQYEAQARRKEELTTETARLGSEREGLVRLVDEIVAKKKEGFFKVFDEINVNFEKVYARLSNGGKADLLLEDPENPFQGGLSMRAQPPGKKVTRLEALSGGEKSLTSMAFIFAIQEYLPSPFYYLDEVDQNLDGINSELLARMVKQEAKNAQFIVVSLRKVTLKEADHVYGVTMMGSGLSEIIGEVRISELADEPAKPEAPAA